VRYPQEKTPDPTELPNPELNPLLNPTLGRNLGRWAEVYFTSPPEKREEAVGELLRELRENPAAAATEAEFAPDDLSLKQAVAALEARAYQKNSEVLTTTTSGVQCAECGHRHPAAQRFCGMCGAPLATDELDPQDYAQQPVATVARREPDPVYHTSIFGLDTSAPATQPSLSDGADINWLREKNLAGGGEGSSGARKLLAALLAMGAIGILIYAQSRPSTRPSPTAATTATPKTENAPQPHPSQETSSAPPASQTASSAPAPANLAANANSVADHSTPAAPAPKQTPLPPEKAAVPTPAAERAPEAKAASATTPRSQPATADASAGAEDFALATEYLNGKRGPRDSAEAAKFLWKAVGKENPSAILLLSDMYLVGDGVPKSCDQARLLLNAAVRKNVPHAAMKLRNLQTAGCP
jgi:hypothetical protein